MVYSNKAPPFPASHCFYSFYLLLTLPFAITRHPGSPGATITQLAFSPTQNTLAWTDNEGIFFRWPQPIPDTLPDPVKVSSTGSTTISINRKPEDTFLFGDNNNDDFGMDGMDDDWIIDDTGGQPMDNELEGKSRKSDFVKEMGK